MWHFFHGGGGGKGGGVCVKPPICQGRPVAEVYKKGLTIEKAFPVQFRISTMPEAILNLIMQGFQE